MARKIVEAYGIDFDTGEFLGNEHIQSLIQKWWDDFENCNNFYIDEGRTIPNKYAQLAFFYIQQYFTNNEIGSQQLHLLFDPALIFNPSTEMTEVGWEAWDIDNAGLLVYNGGNYWGDPNPNNNEYFASMAYFDIQFFIELHKSLTIKFGLQSRFEFISPLMTWIWENRPLP